MAFQAFEQERAFLIEFVTLPLIVTVFLEAFAGMAGMFLARCASSLKLVVRLQVSLFNLLNLDLAMRPFRLPVLARDTVQIGEVRIVERLHQPPDIELGKCHRRFQPGRWIVQKLRQRHDNIVAQVIDLAIFGDRDGLAVVHAQRDSYTLVVSAAEKGEPAVFLMMDDIARPDVPECEANGLTRGTWPRRRGLTGAFEIANLLAGASFLCLE